MRRAAVVFADFGFGFWTPAATTERLGAAALHFDGAGGDNYAAPALVWEIGRSSMKRKWAMAELLPVAAITLGFGTGAGETTPPTVVGGTVYGGVDGVTETHPSLGFHRWPHRGGVDDRRCVSAG
jgi:hypothetical protein